MKGVEYITNKVKKEDFTDVHSDIRLVIDDVMFHLTDS